MGENAKNGETHTWWMLDLQAEDFEGSPKGREWIKTLVSVFPFG